MSNDTLIIQRFFIEHDAEEFTDDTQYISYHCGSGHRHLHVFVSLLAIHKMKGNKPTSSSESSTPVFCFTNKRASFAA